MEQYAYIRVSTKEQHIDRQIMALKPYSISPKNIYCDYQSGKDFEHKFIFSKLSKNSMPFGRNIQTWIWSVTQGLFAVFYAKYRCKR